MAKNAEKWYRVKVVFFCREDFIRRPGGIRKAEGPTLPLGGKEKGEGEHALVKHLDGVVKSARKNLAGSERKP
jgi:hypothetical protein